jgi:hypothetical protein
MARTTRKSAARKALVIALLKQDPHANARTLWSDLGWALNRWSERRVRDAVLHASGPNAMGQVLCELLSQPKILHLPVKRAA